MTYAGERRCHDADSHLMELTDWLPQYADMTGTSVASSGVAG